MAIETLHTLEIIEALENFMDRRRPSEELRSKVDLGYKIEKQSVVIYEIRPGWDNHLEVIECPLAKATYVLSQQIWKVYWRRTDNRWNIYTPNPKVDNIRDFTLLVEEDEYYCFWG